MTTTADTPVAVPAMTNDRLGDLIGVTHSMASRIRYAKRLPGLETMGRIEEVFGWSLRDQLDTRHRGAEAYAEMFRRKVADYQRSHS